MFRKVKKGNIAIILNKPRYSGNIGSSARCAKNMGIERVIVVRSREYDIEKIKKMSTHYASDIIDNIEWYDELGLAISQFNYVVGTTARRGNTSLRQSVFEPKEMAKDLVEISQNNEIALIFGPENKGLTNEELKYCNMLVTIPTSNRFKSINLSHAVMVLCYEILSASYKIPNRYVPRLANSNEVEKMYEHLKEMFLKIDFINQENPDYWMTNVRSLFSRIGLRAKDVKIIRGICRQVGLYDQGKIKQKT